MVIKSVQTGMPATMDEALLSLEDVCRACDVDIQWLRARLREGLVQPLAGSESVHIEARLQRDALDTVAVRRVRTLHRIERDFDAAPELAALVADLIDELHTLRRRVGH